MFKWLLILPLIAFIDPFLFYWMWPHMNMWARLSFLVIYPILATLYSRSTPAPEGDVMMRLLRWLRHVATWYIGPIFKLTSFFLLIPPIEAAVARWAQKKLQAQIMRGMGGMAARVNMKAPSGGGDSGGLKKAKGRVVD